MSVTAFLSTYSQHVVFVLLALYASYVDIRTYKIPDICTYSGLMLIAAQRLVWNQDSFFNALSTAVLSFVVFFLIRRTTKGLGFGDVKYAALIGMYCGSPAIFVAFFAASCSGIAVALLLMAVQKLDRYTPIPFAPFLSFGAIIAQLVVLS
jgi:prepilin signal peptidase PulO-like enzyme (type II secretory pathway)